ncbi:MAG: hypothetical protein A2287_08885 [Candidatus Melainabacteria bacterium RIFOXYA12_FULL_32_12]|nr:MAG: hypothetical protein A2287_08885 [Candidatus Melainabacteria bacterium RIFOXYA12_FULL_32_12]
MKIMLVNNFFSKVGGAENSTNRTGQILAQKGHKVFFFATDKKPYFEENYKYAEYFPEYIDFSSLSKSQYPGYIFNPTYFYNFEAENKLNLYLKKVKPDIVHCNCINYYLSPSILRACYKNNIPIVMTLRDAFLSCPDVGLLYKSETYCQKVLCASGNPVQCIYNKCNDKSLIKSLISATEFALRKIHRLYDKVSVFICPSKALLELAVKSGIPREKLVHINNFIDDSYFKAEPEYSNKGYFLYAGRLVKEKGVHYLLEAMRKIPDIELHIVGSGLEENNLKQLASNLPNVKFLGFKSGQDLENEYKNCIASIIPSNYFEAFGLSIIESFAYGKPVIGSNIGAIPEIIENDKNGIIFESENPDDLTQAVKKLHSNPDLVDKMGKNGRLKAKSLYTPEAYYSKLIEVYQSQI